MLMTILLIIAIVSLLILTICFITDGDGFGHRVILIIWTIIFIVDIIVAGVITFKEYHAFDKGLEANGIELVVNKKNVNINDYMEGKIVGPFVGQYKASSNGDMYEFYAQKFSNMQVLYTINEHGQFIPRCSNVID